MNRTTDRERRSASLSSSTPTPISVESAAVASGSSTSSAALLTVGAGVATHTRPTSNTAFQAPASKDVQPGEESPLPSDQEWWTPSDLAAHLHLTPNAITYHCRRLFPNHPEGHRYRLSHADAVRVYNYVRKFGCKKEPDSIEG